MLDAKSVGSREKNILVCLSSASKNHRKHFLRNAAQTASSLSAVSSHKKVLIDIDYKASFDSKCKF